jgi:tetratricopeptide (TPR) repeat protein
MKRISKALLCAWIAVVVTGVSNAYSADKWLSIRSKNFILVGNASESSIRRVGRTLEEFRAGFAILFPAIGQQSSPPITVVVFKDDLSFRPYKPVYQGKPANIAGFFQSGQDANFIALTGDAQTPRIIYHEFVHSLSKDTTTPLPAWAGEGLAEVYSTFEIESNGKEMLLGKAISEHVLTLQKSFLPVDRLFAVDHASPYYNEGTKQGIFYAESWAVMHYLMLSNNRARQPQLVKFLNLLASGKAINDSFTEAFETDPAKFEKDLTDYISRFTFPAVLFKLQAKIDFEREMTASPLTEAQAQYYLGDLLFHMGRNDAADAQFQKAISLDANFAPTYASFGLMRMREGKHDEALQFLTKAVQADTNNYLAHYNYAFMLQSELAAAAIRSDKSRIQLMRDHVKKTIELAPAYYPAYDMLGYVALLSAEELPQTEAVLKTVLASAPGKRELRIRLAEVMIANNEGLAARVILAPLKNITDDEAVAFRANSLLDQIQRRVENETAMREYNERRLAAEEARKKVEAEAPAAASPAAASEVRRDETPDGPPTIRRNANTTPAGDGTTIDTAAVSLKRPAGRRIDGVLISIDCSKGMTLRVKVSEGNVELHADDPSKIEFVSYTTSVSDSVSCGQLKTQPPVTVIYRAGADPRFLGQPLRVEFTGKK